MSIKFTVNALRFNLTIIITDYTHAKESLLGKNSCRFLLSGSSLLVRDTEPPVLTMLAVSLLSLDSAS